MEVLRRDMIEMPMTSVPSLRNTKDSPVLSNENYAPKFPFVNGKSIKIDDLGTS